MNDITRAMAELSHWFARHNIDARDIRIEIEMPTAHAKYHAQHALRHDFDPVTSHQVNEAGGPAKLSGIEIAFTERGRK